MSHLTLGWSGRRSPAAAILSACLALVAGCSGKPGGMMGGMPPSAVTVRTLKAQSVTLQRELPGRTNAHLVADVRPQVGGIIKSRLFTEGAAVKAGEPLYQVDDAVFRAQLATAQAALARAEASAHVAALAGERSAQLYKSQLVSRQDYDTASATVRQTEADVASAQAAVDMAKLNIQYARILAPISGRIGKSTVTAGALVTANQATALATIQQLDPIYVDVTQSAADWLPLRRAIGSGQVQGRGPGTPVQVRLEDGTAYPHAGRLQFAEVSVDPATGNFQLRVLVPNPDGLLMPGMFVRATVTEGAQAEGLLVPQAAVLHDAKGHAQCYVVGADGKAEERTLQLGRPIGDAWLVESGLAAGDRVVVTGQQKLQPGAAVAATEEGSTPAAAPANGSGNGAPAAAKAR